MGKLVSGTIEVTSVESNTLGVSLKCNLKCFVEDKVDSTTTFEVLNVDTAGTTFYNITTRVKFDDKLDDIPSLTTGIAVSLNTRKFTVFKRLRHHQDQHQSQLKNNR